jgi:hypothetical protein
MSQRHCLFDEPSDVLIANQITPEEMERARAHEVSDEVFNQRLCKLSKIRDLIRLAYRDLQKSGQNREISCVKAAIYLQAGEITRCNTRMPIGIDTRPSKQAIVNIVARK